MKLEDTQINLVCDLQPVVIAHYLSEYRTDHVDEGQKSNAGFDAFDSFISTGHQRSIPRPQRQGHQSSASELWPF